MGNSIRSSSGGLLSDAWVRVEDGPTYFQLGRHVAIDLSKRKLEGKRGGTNGEEWTMSYTVDVSTCELKLTRRDSEGDHARSLLLRVLHTEKLEKNGKYSEFEFCLDTVAIAGEDALAYNFWISKINYTSLSTRQRKKIHAGDSVTETDAFLYGVKHKGGLIVVEKKQERDTTYAVTVAHYFATSTGINDWSKSKIDFGLSVVLKIRASKGNLDIMVEGPEQHPASGLFFLFDEVLRTSTWKPTMCPHCAKNIRRQRNRMLSQSDSEDSDGVPVARRPGSWQSAKRIANDGAFVGNGNGNFINCNKYYGS